MLFYVGTYTRMGGPGIGIGKLENGSLRHLGSEFLPNPTYVILSGNQRVLYAVSSDSADGAEGGSVAAYRVDGSRLTLLSRKNTGGAGPCHLCLGPDGRYLYVANYTGGSLAVFPVTDNGLGERIQFIQHEGRSVHPTRQLSAHVHQVTFIPGTRLLCVVDLGLDAVITYRQDQQTGHLTLAGRLDCTPGSGPRHLTYGNGGVAWLANELGNSVSTLRLQGQTFVMEQVLPSLPVGWSGENTCAAIRSDGRRVLVSNRGHNSLAVYKILPGGKLELSGIHATGGGIPRDFILLPDGLLLVAHQAGDISLLRWDGAQGLTRVTDPLPIGGAVCVCPVLS